MAWKTITVESLECIFCGGTSSFLITFLENYAERTRYHSNL